jgi:hypothetical protein
MHAALGGGRMRRDGLLARDEADLIAGPHVRGGGDRGCGQEQKRQQTHRTAQGDPPAGDASLWRVTVWHPPTGLGRAPSYRDARLISLRASRGRPVMAAGHDPLILCLWRRMAISLARHGWSRIARSTAGLHAALRKRHAHGWAPLRVPPSCAGSLRMRRSALSPLCDAVLVS